MKLSMAVPVQKRSDKDSWFVNDIFTQPGALVACYLHKDYTMGMHEHEFVEINIVARGHGRHFVAGETFEVQAGDVFVIPPNVRHSYSESKSLDVYHLLPHPRLLERHRLELLAMPGFLLFFTVEPFTKVDPSFRYGLELDAGQLSKVKALLEIIRRECVERKYPDEEVAEPLTMALISLLCRYYAQKHRIAPGNHVHTKAIHDVLEYIKTNYTEDIQLADLAGVARMQLNYFCRVFRKVTRLSAMNYLYYFRLEMGKRLLVNADMSITQIACETGFYDAAHFSKMFTKYYGQSPSDFRKYTTAESEK